MALPLKSGQILKAADMQPLLPLRKDYGPVNTNITIGNGSIEAWYWMTGKICHVEYTLTWGSTTSFAGTPGFGVPFSTVSGPPWCGDAYFENVGVQEYPGLARLPPSTASVALYHTQAAGTGNISGTVPFTFGSGDHIRFSLAYEIT